MRWTRALYGMVAFGVLAGSALLVAHRADDGREARSSQERGERGGPAVADLARGARLFGQCAVCHPIGRDLVDRDGPNLYGVVGSPVAGRRPRFAYTAALRRFGGRWSRDRLDAWIADPTALVPGTTMAFRGLPDAKDRADVIAFLSSQGPQPPASHRPEAQ